MDIEGFRKAGYAAVDQICDYYYALQQNKYPVAAQVSPGFLSKQLPGEAPERGEAWDAISKDYADIILPGITHWQSPTFMAFYPCNATFEGGLADLHAAMISNPGFNWACSPSVTELEIITLDWIAKMLGLNESFWSTSSSGTGGGIILGSASEVALTVAIAARERALHEIGKRSPPTQEEVPTDTPTYLVNGNGAADAAAIKEPEVSGSTDSNEAPKKQSFEPSQAAVAVENSTLKAPAALAQWRGSLTARLVMYGTTQTHSVAAKAALILGLGFRALPVKKEDGFALRGATLKAALEEDDGAGRVPFMLIASLGTTSSAATDNLTEVMEVAKDHPSLWVHVDAAYAGVALALPEVRPQCHMDALQQVDSFSTNYHKWGLVQFDCSPLLVRDRTALSSALTVTPEFLKTRSKQGEKASLLDMRNMQIPLGRRFRSLKVWFVLRSYGVEGFRAHLRSGIELAKQFENLVQSDPRFELVAPPAFSLRVIRIRSPTASSQEEVDALNRKLWDILQTRSDEVLLTQTVLPEVGFCIRVAIGSPLTKQEHVDAAWKVIRECADVALAS